VSAPRPRKLGLGSIALIVLGLFVLAILAPRQSRTLKTRLTLQLDDFCFTVEKAARLPADPSKSKQSESSTGRIDYLVTLKIENRARRVPCKFSGESLGCADLSGTKPLTRPSAERAPSGELHPPVLHILQAGESRTLDYVFSLPPDLQDLRLRIAPGGWSGDLLEWLFFGRKEFQLP
jgi:hypothetical protein